MELNSSELKEALFKMANYHGVFIDEFTFGNHRIDGIIVDTAHRWIRGFEIKISRNDFLNDTKWVEYSRFVSSLSIVCPEGLIDKSEIENPFGLLYISKNKYNHFEYKWVKRPKCFQKRNSLAWLYTYTMVIEKELPRMRFEMLNLRAELNYLNRRAKEQ